MNIEKIIGSLEEQKLTIKDLILLITTDKVPWREIAKVKNLNYLFEEIFKGDGRYKEEGIRLLLNTNVSRYLGWRGVKVLLAQVNKGAEYKTISLSLLRAASEDVILSNLQKTIDNDICKDSNMDKVIMGWLEKLEKISLEGSDISNLFGIAKRKEGLSSLIKNRILRLLAKDFLYCKKEDWALSYSGILEDFLASLLDSSDDALEEYAIRIYLQVKGRAHVKHPKINTFEKSVNLFS